MGGPAHGGINFNGYSNAAPQTQNCTYGVSQGDNTIIQAKNKGTPMKLLPGVKCRVLSEVNKDNGNGNREEEIHLGAHTEQISQNTRKSNNFDESNSM